jgi:AhpD family alkylhydroperoxidase
MDWFWRPTVTPQRAFPWVAELGRTADGLLRAFGRRGGALAPATREEISLAVSTVNGCRTTMWVHTAWRDFLGGEDSQEIDESLALLVAFARDAALAGHPVDHEALDRALPPETIRAARAVVALAELSSLVGNTADGLWQRLCRRRPMDPLAALGEGAIVLAAVPFAAPLLAAAGAMRLAADVAPPLPAVTRPGDDEANLVVHLLAEAIPVYLANAVTRAFLLHLPRPVVVGIRAEGAEATVRISREEIRLSNEIDPEASVVIDDGADLLLEVTGRSLNRELRALGAPPRR